jgi:outer membrane biogenesis lipoprotein LolB
MKKVLIFTAMMSVFLYASGTFAADYEVRDGQVKEKRTYTVNTLTDWVVKFEYVDAASGQSITEEKEVEARSESTAQAVIKLKYKKKIKNGTLKFLSTKEGKLKK